MAREGLGASTLLVRLQVALASHKAASPPGRLVEPGARQNNETHIHRRETYHIDKKDSPRVLLGEPDVLYLIQKIAWYFPTPSGLNV